jgi:ubiquinone/menaquinone biosynthesis C-methylase UbiE
MATRFTGIADAFTACATDYDRLRRKLIPCFDAFYGHALELVARWDVNPAPRILDLGAGTGLFSSLVLERLPQAHVHLVDISAGMVDQAKLRFRDRPNVSFEIADYIHDPLGGSWDVIISGLSIHYLDDQEKRELFRRIHEALSSNGLFVNADRVLGPTVILERQYQQLWLEAVQAAGVGPEDIKAAQERMNFELCATLEDQLRWMRDAGFSNVDCTFKSWQFAVMSGH